MSTIQVSTDEVKGTPPQQRPISARIPFGRLSHLYDKIEAFVSRLSVRDHFWQRVCSLIWLPYAFFSGIRIKQISAETYGAILPFRRFNRNWYRAMAGGALLANSEIAGGMYVFGICGGDYTVVCKHLEYTFLRPCFGPAVYRMTPRENVRQLLADAAEFNVTLDMEILQQVSTPGERDKRVGRAQATFHVTPKIQQKLKNARKKSPPAPLWSRLLRSRRIKPAPISLHFRPVDQSVDESPSHSRIISAARVAGWAVYLAMSWTWCIGMYLPVLIMRELGFAGVITFAVPNIVGAAAMGWALRNEQQSRRIIAENRSAFIGYSLVTIAFHAFFAAWIIRRIAGPYAGAAVVAMFLFFWMILHWRRGGEFLAAALTLLASAALIGWGFWRHELPYVAHPVLVTRLSPINNLCLAPAWILGFVCCPWLDLTFHRARQVMSRGEARTAFSLGFGVLFAAMLLLTVAYSGWLVVGFDRSRYPQLAIILGGYLIVQSCFTVALHAQQMSRLRKKISIRRFLGFSALLVIAVLLGILSDSPFTYSGIALGELIYRGFLGFYGLIFPAYVWLCMTPPRRSLLRAITVIVIALPLYWLAFANEQMAFAVPGVLVVFLAKFFPTAQTAAG